MGRDNWVFVMIWIMASSASVAGWCNDRPPAPRAPHVVLILVDALRSDHIGCYGYSEGTTSVIDQFASEGVLFERCYSAASWTLPATMSMFTGWLPNVHGCVKSLSRLPESIPTLPEAMRDNGYHCTAVVSNPFLNAKYGFGRGFHHYDDYSVFLSAELAAVAGRATKPNDLVTGPSVVRQCTIALEAAAKTKMPVFLFVHLMDVHDSYIPHHATRTTQPSSYRGKVDGRNVAQMRMQPPSGQDLDRLRSLYDGEIRFTDGQIGKLLAEVDRVLGAETLVVLTSDHGESFAEHGRLLHGNSVFNEEISVPMVFRWRGTLKPGRVSDPVSGLDLCKTICDLTAPAQSPSFGGVSLVDALRGQPMQPRAIISERALEEGPEVAKRRYEFAVMTPTHSFHAQFDRAPDDAAAMLSLYNVVQDPQQQRDILRMSDEIATELRATLLSVWTECMQKRSIFHKEGDQRQVELTEQERRRLTGFGYLAK